MSSIFNLFGTKPYTFLRITQEAEGNTIAEEYDALGVFKSRSGMSAGRDIETPTADATIHIYPTEAFIDDVGGDLVGHGIRFARDDNDAQTYRIIGQTEGYNYDDSSLDFYLLTLKKERIATWESELPLT